MYLLPIIQRGNFATFFSKLSCFLTTQTCYMHNVPNHENRTLFACFGVRHDE